jgi:non-ribosomal peptide synthetase-like protein
VDGTIFKNFFLKSMGVKIGKNVYIQKGANVIMGGWDLLTIGDNVTIGREASVRTMDFEYGKMVFGKIEIGNDCTLETRASMSINSTMKDNSKLTGLSMLESFGVIPENEVWEGVPARLKEKNNPLPAHLVHCTTLSPIKHGLTLMMLRGFMYLFTYIHVPLIAGFVIWFWQIDPDKVVDWIWNNQFTLESMYYFSLIAVFFCFIRLVLQALFCRLLGEIKPGYYCRYGTKYIHMWLKDMMVELSGNTLSGTLYWPYWLRLAGMKIGKNCEISTIMNVVPELVNIDCRQTNCPCG